MPAAAPAVFAVCKALSFSPLGRPEKKTAAVASPLPPDKLIASSRIRRRGCYRAPEPPVQQIGNLFPLPVRRLPFSFFRWFELPISAVSSFLPQRRKPRPEFDPSHLRDARA